jgi:hypothetical protein
VRHEVEQQRLMEERERIAKEEAQKINVLFFWVPVVLVLVIYFYLLLHYFYLFSFLIFSCLSFVSSLRFFP